MSRSRVPWLYRFVSDRTGQSEAIGVVLLIGLTLTGSGVVVVYGSQAIRGTTESTDLGQAEHAMTQLDSKASLVAHGSSDVQHVSVGRDRRGDVHLDEDAGWMRIVNDSIGNETTVMNVSMGAVVYERGETTVAYQGGGVWRQGPSGSTMVSQPEFHYRGRTLTLPLVLVRGDGNGISSGRLRLGQAGSPVGWYPTAAANRSNPLTDGEISVTVRSDYYEAWGRFFTKRTGGNVSLDHTNRTATLELVIPDTTDRVRGAILSTGSSDEIDLQGGGSFPAFVDSYNSTAGDYGTSQQDNGTIITTGGVELAGNSEIEGSIRSGGTVSLDAASSQLSGTAYWTTGFSANPSATWGGEQQIDGVTAPDSASSVTRGKVDDLSTDNDNGATAAVGGADPRLQFSGGSVTLTPGNYYLDSIDASGGKKIIFDTNGGTITVGVENSAALEEVDASVEDGGSVRLYVKDDVDFGKGVTIGVPGDVAKRFWIYGTQRTTFDMQANQGDQSSVVGVFYAPGDEGGGNADVSLKHTELYGGVVAGDVDVETGGAVHYDEALSEEEPFPVGVSVPRVTFLHVSTNRVNVTA